MLQGFAAINKRLSSGGVLTGLPPSLIHTKDDFSANLTSTFDQQGVKR